MNIQYQAVIRSQEEQDVCDRVIELVNRLDCGIDKIRFARKDKSFGSTGVRPYHLYYYRADNTIELQINLAVMGDGSKHQFGHRDWLHIIQCDLQTDKSKAWIAKHKAKTNDL